MTPFVSFCHCDYVWGAEWRAEENSKNTEHSTWCWQPSRPSSSCTATVDLTEQETDVNRKELQCLSQPLGGSISILIEQ